MGTIIFDLRGYGGCSRPKTPFRGQKELIHLTKVSIKLLSQCAEQPQSDKEPSEAGDPSAQICKFIR